MVRKPTHSGKATIVNCGMVALSAIVGVALAGCAQQDRAGPKGNVGISRPSVAGTSSEARIQQQAGRVLTRGEAATSGGSKPASAAGSPGQAAPASCGQQNSTDPACHAATQQTRSPVR